jgi:hypothetical protein
VGGIFQEQESNMSLNDTWRRERGIVRRQIVIDCGIYDPEKLDQICAVVAAHDGASDADLTKAVFAAFPNATLGVILAACHLISNGWQPAKDAALICKQESPDAKPAGATRSRHTKDYGPCNTH